MKAQAGQPADTNPNRLEDPAREHPVTDDKKVELDAEPNALAELGCNVPTYELEGSPAVSTQPDHRPSTIRTIDDVRGSTNTSADARGVAAGGRLASSKG